MYLPSAEQLKIAIVQFRCRQDDKVRGCIAQMPENPAKDDFLALNELTLQK
jgi:hypothetical protein